MFRICIVLLGICRIVFGDLEGDLFEKINGELAFLNRATAKLEWAAATNNTATVTELKRNLAEVKATWKNRWCTKLQQDLEFESAEVGEMFRILCRGPKYTPDLARDITSVVDRLSSIYTSAKICKFENGNEQCYYGESDVASLMTKSSRVMNVLNIVLKYLHMNETELRWAWTAWRDQMHKMKDLFTLLVDLQNVAARGNGYTNIGEYWREEFRQSNLEDLFEELFDRIRPLYLRLHAVVRFRLAKIYPGIVDLRGPIPAHLLGNLWSQSWDPLLDLLLPAYSKNVPSLSHAMKQKNYTVNDVVKKADEFYVSLGFPPTTPEFWENSIFEKQSGANFNCHATAANMYSKDDFRIIACLEPRAEDFHVIHHEIGHIQYYMAYQDQPAMFKNAPNSAFHEAVGDAVMYGASSLQHLQRLGLIQDSYVEQSNSSSSNSSKHRITRKTLEIATLLRQALTKLPQISNGLAMEKWRWAVFDGRIKPSEYNDAWWNLYRMYMGIVPPSKRPKDSFDPGAKFHIPNNVPYARYFLASILQVQLFQGMCESAVTGHVGDEQFNLPLHQCDIYGFKNAGKNLRSMMELGSSVDWRTALQTATGFSEYSVEPLLKYYEPVRRWLELEIERYDIPIGWD